MSVGLEKSRSTACNYSFGFCNEIDCDDIMAIYTTHFVATEDALFELFPDWLVPLSQPVLKKEVNPFTGETFLVRDWSPPVDAQPATESRAEVAPENWWTRLRKWWSAVAAPLSFTATCINEPYETYLKNRIPDSIKPLPHWCTKNLYSLAIFPLYVCLDCTPCESGEFMQRPARIAPSDCSAALEMIPKELTLKLARLPDSSVDRIAEQWKKDEIWRDADPDVTIAALQELMRLAKCARNRADQIYVLIEC